GRTPRPPPGGALVAAPDDDAPEPAGFRTAADGGFAIAHVGPGRYVARAAPPDFAAAESAPFAAGAPVTLVLRRGGDVSGRVTDDRGVPLLGAELTLLQAGRAIAVTFVDKEARYRFAPGLREVVVRAAPPGHAPVRRGARPPRGGGGDPPPRRAPAAAAAAARP